MTDPIQPQLVEGGDTDIWYLWARGPGRVTGLPVGGKAIQFIVLVVACDLALALVATFIWFTTGMWAVLAAYGVLAVPLILVACFFAFRGRTREVQVPDGPEPINVRMNKALTDAARRLKGEN